MEGKGAWGSSSCFSNQMLELKLGCAMCCTPRGHSTEEAMFVPDPAGPHAEPWRQLCPWGFQLPVGQQRPRGTGQCHEPLPFQPPTKQMRCLKPHFGFKQQQRFHFPRKSLCALAPKAPQVRARGYHGHGCAQLLPWPAMQPPLHTAAEASLSPLFQEAAVVAARL